MDERPDELIQPILVSKGDACHEDVVTWVAHASCMALINSYSSPAWEHWLAGRFTKSVRRATWGSILRTKEYCDYLKEVSPNLMVASFKPMTYNEMPKPISGARVEGLVRDFGYKKVGNQRIYYKDNLGGPTVWINESLEMSTGKAAAQAAHGVMKWLLENARAEAAFFKEDYPAFSVIGIGQEEFDRKRADSYIQIIDSGLTELQPGECTVVVSR